MTETEAFAKIGRLTCQIEQQDTAYTQLLNVLAGVVRGDITRERVLVNLTARTWEVSEPGTSPGMPSQINGLPEIAVAPPLPAKTEFELEPKPAPAPDAPEAEKQLELLKNIAGV